LPAARSGCWRTIRIPTSPRCCSTPSSTVPIAAACARERQRWQVLDAAFADDFATLTHLDPGGLPVTGMSRDRQHWLIAYLRDDAPLKYFHYDRGRRAAQKR